LDVYKVLEIIWERKALFLASLLLGIIFSVLSIYNFAFDFSGGQILKITPKQFGTYVSNITVVIGDPQYSLGRAGNDSMFSDSLLREMQLARIYPRIVKSSSVLSPVMKKMGKVDLDNISTRTIQDTPAIQITVKDKDPKRAHDLNLEIFKSFANYLQLNQKKNEVPENDRIYIHLLLDPKVNVEGSKKVQLFVLALFSPIILAFLLSLVLFNLNAGKRSSKRSVKKMSDKKLSTSHGG
jgi:capsular polysaccharide biosynthesis protein